MRVEGFVVGAAGVAQRDGGDAKILQRLNPLGKDRRHRSVLLQVDTANLAAAVVEVEVAGNLLILGLELDRAARLAHPLRQLHLIGSRRQRHVAEVLLHVTVRAELAFLLAGPQAQRGWCGAASPEAC